MPNCGSIHHIIKIQVLVKSKLIIECMLSLIFKKCPRNGWLKGFTGVVRKIIGECYLQTIGSVPILFIFKYFLKTIWRNQAVPNFLLCGILALFSFSVI